MQPKRLTILGVGLLGGSIGLAAKSLATPWHVVGYAHRAETRQAALNRGAVDEACADPLSAARDADCVILCTPVGVLSETLSRVAPVLKAGAIVTDVGSTKRHIVAHAAKVIPSAGPEIPYFVGSHPMAGSDKRGVEHAHEDLFKNAICILTPSESTNAGALSRVSEFWQSLGMRIEQVSPEVHDRLMADISHLPHAVAAALLAIQSEASLRLRGRGFMDSTRIAAGDAGLWRDILLDNRDNLAHSIRTFQATLSNLLIHLDHGDAEAVRQWLSQSAERRQTLM